MFAFLSGDGHAYQLFYKVNDRLSLDYSIPVYYFVWNGCGDAGELAGGNAIYFSTDAYHYGDLSDEYSTLDSGWSPLGLC